MVSFHLLLSARCLRETQRELIFMDMIKKLKVMMTMALMHSLSYFGLFSLQLSLFQSLCAAADGAAVIAATASVAQEVKKENKREKKRKKWK